MRPVTTRTRVVGGNVTVSATGDAANQDAIDAALASEILYLQQEQMNAVASVVQESAGAGDLPTVTYQLYDSIDSLPDGVRQLYQALVASTESHMDLLWAQEVMTAANNSVIHDMRSDNLERISEYLRHLIGNISTFRVYDYNQEPEAVADDPAEFPVESESEINEVQEGQDAQPCPDPGSINLGSIFESKPSLQHIENLPEIGSDLAAPIGIEFTYHVPYKRKKKKKLNLAAGTLNSGTIAAGTIHAGTIVANATGFIETTSLQNAMGRISIPQTFVSGSGTVTRGFYNVTGSSLSVTQNTYPTGMTASSGIFTQPPNDPVTRVPDIADIFTQPSNDPVTDLVRVFNSTNIFSQSENDPVESVSAVDAESESQRMRMNDTNRLSGVNETLQDLEVYREITECLDELNNMPVGGVLSAPTPMIDAMSDDSVPIPWEPTDANPHKKSANPITRMRQILNEHKLLDGYGSRVYEGGTDIAEVCSPIFKTKTQMSNWFLQVDGLAKKHRYTTWKKSGGGGGVHLNVSYNETVPNWRLAYTNFFIMVANHPEINWIFNEPSDNHTANGLVLEDRFISTYHKLVTTKNRVVDEDIWNDFAVCGSKGRAINSKSHYHFEMRTFRMVKNNEELIDIVDFVNALLTVCMEVATWDVMIPLDVEIPVQYHEDEERGYKLPYTASDHLVYPDKMWTAEADFNQLLRWIDLDPKRYRKYIRRNLLARRGAPYGKKYMT